MAGCHQYPDMFVDDMPDSSMVTTMSAQHARRVKTTPKPRRRDFEPVRLQAQDGAVAHGPLWMEDSSEMKGSDDGQFAVTIEDVIYFNLIGPVRFAANIFLLPVRMVMDPPRAIMCSDGIERRSHESGASAPYDPERCTGTTMPIDIYEAWTFDEQANLDTPLEGALP